MISEQMIISLRPLINFYFLAETIPYLSSIKSVNKKFGKVSMIHFDVIMIRGTVILVKNNTWHTFNIFDEDLIARIINACWMGTVNSKKMF